MKLPTLRQKKAVATQMEPSTMAPTQEPSTATTSTSDLEKPPVEPVLGNVSAPHSHAEKTVEETAIQEAAALDKLSDEPEYPKGVKLAVITAALCLSVFLMALVCTLLFRLNKPHDFLIFRLRTFNIKYYFLAVLLLSIVIENHSVESPNRKVG